MKNYFFYLLIVASVIIVANLSSFFTGGDFFEYLAILTLVLAASNVVETQNLKNKKK